MNHILLSGSYQFPATTEPEVDGWFYSREASQWMPNLDAASGERRVPPKSKKCDHETGEDMKGT